MKWLLYAVLDMKADEYGNVIQAKTDAVAVRMFSEAVRDPELMIGKYPADYALCRVGSFEAETGEIVPEEPTLVVRGETLSAAMAESGGEHVASR